VSDRHQRCVTVGGHRLQTTASAEVASAATRELTQSEPTIADGIAILARYGISTKFWRELAQAVGCLVIGASGCRAYNAVGSLL